MSKRTAESREKGPRSIDGLASAGTSGELPPVDLSIGAKQRFRVRVPTEDTTLLLGARVPVARVEDDTQQLGYDGFNAITTGYVFLSAKTGTATLSSAGRMYVVSTGDALALVAKKDVLVGTRGSVAIGSRGSTMIFAGAGPSATESATSGETPDSTSHASYSSVTGDLITAAAFTTASVSLLFGAIKLSMLLQKGDLHTWLTLTSTVFSMLNASKSIVEEASGRTIVSRKGLLGAKLWSKQSSNSEILVYGKDGITVTTGAFPGTGVTMLAPAGSVKGVAGISAGVVAGISASLWSGWSSSVHALVVTTMQSAMTASVTAWSKATIDARIGAVSVQGVTVEAGELVSTSPQLPTMFATVSSNVLVDLQAGVAGTPSVAMNGLLGTVTTSALAKVTLQTLPWKVEVTPTGVSIVMGALGAKIAPTSLAFDLVTSKLELGATAIKATCGACSLEVSPTGTKLSGPVIVIG